ncbi:MAG: FecR domain-containing protein [Spirochaetes bacterium]|nr:FecR domain-containing protein [Spirochaetota bacterium]
MKRALIITIVMFSLSLPVYAQQGVGKIIQLVNDVDITSLTTGKRIVPEIGFIVHTDHKIRTGKRSFVEILLDNGTRLQLKDISVLNVSSLKLTKNDEPTRLRLITGKVRVSLKKIYRDGHSLILKTPTAIAGVRGTDFGVIASQFETKVLVFEGKLDIASSNASILKSQQLGERDECDIVKDREPSNVRKLPSNLVDTWFERYEIDARNRIIRKRAENEGILDDILRKRQY